MRRLVFLILPPFIKSASDVVGARTITELRKLGVDAQLSLLWSDAWARRLLSSRTRVGHLAYKYLFSLPRLARLYNRFGPDDVVWMYDISLYARPVNTLLERHILRRGAKLVFQFHDNWLESSYRQAALNRIDLASLLGGVTRGILEEVKRHAGAADVELLRAPIDTERLRPLEAIERTEPPRVVWTGNIGNLREIPGAAHVLRSVYQVAPFDFLVISGSRRPEIDLPIPWRWLPYNAEHEAARISGACAGLAPLEDRPYARCKDVFKVKTYMACGIPSIATAIGNNLEVIENGKTGFLVGCQQEWHDRLLALVQSPELAQRIGVAAREDCVRRFSHAAIIPEWIEVLERHFGSMRNQ